MKFRRVRIDKNEWIEHLKQIGSDKKWFLYLLNQYNTECFNLYIDSLKNESIIVGAYTISNSVNIVDCSIFIFPKYRRNGIAKDFITELISKNEKIQFTVSKYNIISLNLFKSLNTLLNIDFNDKENSIIITKKD
jgi:RimJ/RimL family protein N-acetyltransferase